MRKIYPKEEYCLGCTLCEVYCAVEHSRSKNIFKAFKETPFPVKRILVETKNHDALALSCRHCDEPECMRACIAGAITKDKETGVVATDYDKCVGCWMCIMACSFGAIRRGSGEKIALRCDLCPDAAEPACVAYCPNEALVYEEREKEAVRVGGPKKDEEEEEEILFDG